ncbi:hypothetical protein D9M70_651830 [compost metagenome]
MIGHLNDLIGYHLRLSPQVTIAVTGAHLTCDTNNRILNQLGADLLVQIREDDHFAFSRLIFDADKRHFGT